MPSNPADDVFPDGSPVNKSLVRGLFSDRVVLRLEDADELRAMDTNGANLFVIDGVLWQYDPSDTTTPDNGTTVLVSNDGGRYDRFIAEIPYIGLIPQGRLTLTSATPVMTTGVSGAATVYYALHTGNLLPITPDGTGFKMRVFSQLSNVLANSATGKAGPAAAANNTNYDLFAWDDAGTIRLTRGPAWTSDTGRGTGSGTTELARLAGVLVNAVAITNGPPQNKGTYLGTIRTNGSATVDVAFGSTPASGGSAGFIGIWNAYNRTPVMAEALESDNSWNYTTASYRAYNNSNSNRVSFVRGLDLDIVMAEFTGGATTSSGSVGMATGIGLDSTSAASGVRERIASSTSLQWMSSRYRGFPGLGFHYLQALEFGGTNGTFYGDGSAPASWQAGLQAVMTW